MNTKQVFSTGTSACGD